ncbi:MAG: thiamine pyrophosphate-dependent enzyme, partial [Pseudomonadota bacterium]
HTATSTDLVAMARGAGIHNSARVSNEQDLAIAISSLYETEGPVFINIKVDSVNPPMCLPPRDGIHVKNRFRAGLGLSPN